MNNKILPVVIPVYNVEKYLDRCIKSIINQTYKNLEIILEDDGSKDYSGIICDKYASRDKRMYEILISDLEKYEVDKLPVII